MLETQDVCPSSTAHLTNEEWRERRRQNAHVISVLMWSFAQDAAEFAKTDAWEEDGSATAIDWIRFNCNMASGAAANSVAVGETIARLPESSQALTEGEIGFAHLTTMARTADALDERFDEAPLLQKARENSPGKFYRICEHYRHAADPKRYAAEQAEQVEDRYLKLSTWQDGSLMISGQLDPAGGAAFLTAAKPLARKMGADDDRRQERRYAEAALEFASAGGCRAHNQGTTSVETRLGLSAAPAPAS